MVVQRCSSKVWFFGISLSSISCKYLDFCTFPHCTCAAEKMCCGQIVCVHAYSPFRLASFFYIAGQWPLNQSSTQICMLAKNPATCRQHRSQTAARIGYPFYSMPCGVAWRDEHWKCGNPNPYVHNGRLDPEALNCCNTIPFQCPLRRRSSILSLLLSLSRSLLRKSRFFLVVYALTLRIPGLLFLIQPNSHIA